MQQPVYQPNNQDASLLDVQLHPQQLQNLNAWTAELEASDWALPESADGRHLIDGPLLYQDDDAFNAPETDFVSDVAGSTVALNDMPVSMACLWAKCVSADTMDVRITTCKRMDWAKTMKASPNTSTHGRTCKTGCATTSITIRSSLRRTSAVSCVQSLRRKETGTGLEDVIQKRWLSGGGC